MSEDVSAASWDVERDVLSPLFGDRPFRTYPVMLSTEAEALAWARTGAVHGATVVAGHQVAARGRSGLSFAERFPAPGVGIGCSVVVHPDVPPEQRGWLYPLASLAVHDVLAAEDRGLRVEWPDLVVDGDGTTRAAVGVQVEEGPAGLRWAVVTILVPDATQPRGPAVAALLTALDERLVGSRDEATAAYTASCATLGRRVEASVLPMGPASPTFLGEAVEVAPDGGLVIATDDGPRAVVLPETLGFVRDPTDLPMGPSGIG